MPISTPFILSDGITDDCHVGGAGTIRADTHYAVLAYHLQTEHRLFATLYRQHSQYIWMQPGQAMQPALPNPHTQAYLESIQK